MIARVNDKILETNGEQMMQYYFDGKEWHQKWEKKLDATEIVITKQTKELETILQQIREGQLSPLAYHSQINLFSINLLSSYTGMSKFRIKKHLKPSYFNQLNEETLQKYATLFEISVEELKKIPE